MNKSLMIGLIVMAIIISGCTSNRAPAYTITGHEGLVFTLLKHSPSSRLVPRSGGSISVTIQNMGAATTKSGDDKGIYVWWDLTPEAYINKSELVQNFVDGNIILQGRLDTGSVGEVRNVYLGRFDLNGIDTILGEFSEAYLYLNIYACYPYFTLLEDKECVDISLLHDSVNPSVCREETKTYPLGQGAPIDVYAIIPETTIKEYGSGNNKATVVVPAYRIKIRNYGRGVPLFDPHLKEEFDVEAHYSVYSDACEKVMNNDRDTVKKSVNKVHIIAYLSDINMSCSPEIVTLVDGEAETICSVPIDKAKELSTASMSSYYAPITIRLDYDYFERPITREILINKRP